MRQGIKLFEHFTTLILESRVGIDREEQFVKEYSLHTGINCKEDVIVRIDSSAWNFSLDTKIYFDAPDFVIDSLKRMGIHIVKGVLCSLKNKYSTNYENIKQCKYSISNNWLFWWLVDYGYRLGENNAIPYDFYLMRQALKAYQERQNKHRYLWHFDINEIEAENPTMEAEMLMGM